jgi:hypothetical protein
MIKETIGISLAILLVGIVSAQIIWDEDSTVINLKGFGCPSPYQTWIDAMIDPPIKYNTIALGGGKIYDCRDPFGGSSCCPSDSKCEEVASGLGVSPLPGYAIDGKNFTCMASSEIHCGQFTNSYDCENKATIADAKASVEMMPGKGVGFCDNITASWKNASGALCWNQTLCECVWDAGLGICEGNHYLRRTCEKDSQRVGPPPDCYWQITDDNGCNNGEEFMHMVWTYVSGDGTASCGDSWEADIDCGQIVKISFFTVINIIAAVVIIGIVYYIYNRRNPENTKKRKKKNR